MDDLKKALNDLKRDIEAYDAMLHRLRDDAELNETSASYRLNILDLAFQLKKKLIDIDISTVGLLNEI